MKTTKHQTCLTIDGVEMRVVTEVTPPTPSDTKLQLGDMAMQLPAAMMNVQEEHKTYILVRETGIEAWTKIDGMAAQVLMMILQQAHCGFGYGRRLPVGGPVAALVPPVPE